MSDQVQKAREVLKTVLQEFEPTKGHFVTGTREFLLALRSVIDAQIRLLDRATGKKGSGTGEDVDAPKVIE
jgi:hypothetical protein